MPAPPRVLLKTTVDKGLVEKPALAAHFNFHAIDETQVFLISETVNTLLRGEVYPDLLELLDGSYTYSEIVDDLAYRHSEASIRTAIIELATKGYLVSAEHSMDTGEAALWTSLGSSPCYVEERLASSPVTVSGDCQRLSNQLRSMKVKITDKAVDSALDIIVCDDYLDEHLLEINRQHLESGIPWVLIKPEGIQPLFGPVFRPLDRGPCLACLAYRYRGHQEVHNYLRNLTDADISLAARSVTPHLCDTVQGMAAFAIAKWLVLEKNTSIHQRAIGVDFADLSLTHHTISRRPQCLVCGDSALNRSDREIVPIQLKSSPKRVRNSGGVRSMSPVATVDKFRQLVDPVGGVVSWLRRTTDEFDPWLHVYWAGSNIALRNRKLSLLQLSLRTKSAGKGSTSQQSEASAICEALERYCGAFHGDEIRCRKRFSELSCSDSDAVIHPNDIQLFSDLQIRDAVEINARGHPYNVVPHHFDPDSEIDFSPVWSVTRDGPAYVPTSLLYYGKSASEREAHEFTADSNGCAAGNTLEEAVLQGFLELVERDAFAVWWYNRLSMPAVDLASFGDDYLDEASGYYRKFNREIWVLDVTSDFEIPVFVALSRRTDKAQEDIIYGAGAHFDPHIAALRAVCELNQFLNWAQGTGPGGAGYQVDDPQCLSWWQTATLVEHPYLMPNTEMTPRTLSDYVSVETDDLREDIKRCQSLVETKGMELLVLDQTRPDINLPVARVIVPGMRHYWQRFAPGRLYEVPVELGWRSSQLTESELNPAPVIG